MQRLRPSWKWWLPAACAMAVTGLLAWTALAPIAAASRDALFEIPQGTWARRMAGDLVDILPRQIILTLGVNDTLLLRNRDTVPQVFGPVLIMPGQDFRLPFDTVSVNEFNCTAHASGSMKVVVEPYPAPGLPRLQWRLAHLEQQLRKAISRG